MNYKEAIGFIENTAKFGSNLGLSRIKKLLEYIGNPQDNIKCIHVAGTNGKGSVTSIISRILMENNFKVGIYTSPYLQRFSERIKIGDMEISEIDIARLVSFIEPYIQRLIEEGFEHPTEFEIITAIMFKYFNENNVDFAVLEVGLGGRLDATNVIEPLVSVITSISFDHMAILGDTLSKIAYEKAGIIKENGIVVTYPQEYEAYEAIKKVCEEKNAKLIEVSNSGINLKEYSIYGQKFDLKIDLLNSETIYYENINMRLIGEYQLLNAKTAITAVNALKFKDINIALDSIYNGLSKVCWPGRLEIINKEPIILLDGAHNIQGINSLKDAIAKYFNNKKIILVMGVLKDKQVDEMSNVIMKEAKTIITTEPISDRALKAEKLGEIANLYCNDVIICPVIDNAIKEALNRAAKDDIIIFCGSLYMIGHVREILTN